MLLDRVRYTTLLYIAFLFLAVLLAGLLLIDNAVTQSGSARLTSTVDQYQHEQAIQTSIRANVLQSRYLFERNLQIPTVSMKEVLDGFIGLRIQARELDQKLGAGLAGGAGRALAAYYKGMQLLQQEEQGSYIIEELFHRSALQLDALLNQISNSPHSKTLLHDFYNRTSAQYELLDRFRVNDPEHVREIGFLLLQCVGLLDEIDYNQLGTDLHSYRKDIKRHIQQLRSGVHSIYAADSPVNQPQNEALAKEINLTYDSIASLLELYKVQVPEVMKKEMSSLETLLAKKRRIFLLLMTLGLLAGLVGINYFLRLVKRRIRKLSEATLSIGQGNYSTRCSIKSDDDLGKLSSTLNIVATSLAAAEQEVIDTKKGLEDKVKARTQELMLASKVIDSVSEGIVITDSDNHVVKVNPAYTDITGYAEAEVLGQNVGFVKSGLHDDQFYQGMWRCLDGSGAWQGEVWNRRKCGDSFPQQLSITVIKDEQQNVSHNVGVFTDITKQKRSEERLAHLAFYDQLTQLPNRALFKERLERMCVAGERDHQPRALLYIDLDNFKGVNDTLGHDAGDELLVEVSERLQRIVKRDSDTLARIGGDEFTVILDSISHMTDVLLIVESIIKELQRPIRVKGTQVVVGCSIGVAMYPDDGNCYEVLTKHADISMYKAKANGRNTHVFYHDELITQTAETLQLEVELRQALPQKEFVLFYQPKWDLRSGCLVGFEALIRWQRNGTLIPPVKFISLLEDSRLIIDVGLWVIETAAVQIKNWEAQFGRTIPIAVNVSGRQLMDHSFLEQVTSLKQRHIVADGTLEIEITESVIMEDPEYAAEILKGLNVAGLPVAIDDFGTGYSSLSYLKQFQLSALKIDGSFIQDIMTDQDDEAIVAAILSLSEKLNIDVVVEGVETQQQLQRLQELSIGNGIVQCQGYLLSPPVTNVDAESFIQGSQDPLI